MKKSLIALAVLAAAGTASAQSSVTLFGIVDATIQRVSNGGAGGGSVTRLHNSGESSSRLGFRGTEDLGGGMSASFWLEAGVNNDDGTGQTLSTNNQFAATSAFASGGGEAGRNARAQNGTGLVFNRRSTVSLAGGFGEIRLGRDYTPQFWNLTVFDPYGTVGVGTNLMTSLNVSGPTSVRASNTIGYFLPGNLGGFYGQIQHYRGENSSTVANSGDGNGTAFRFGYAAGPVNVAIASGRTSYSLVTALATATSVTGGAQPAGSTRATNIAGSWNFGFMTLMAQASRDKADALAGVGGGSAKGKGYLLGATAPIGAGVLKFAASQYTTDYAGAGTDPRARKYALGYVHNLSKRTAVYTTIARVQNNSTSAVSVFNGAAAAPALGAHSTGYDLGIRHSF
ncbi:porin [Ramlibacter sp. MMS24-I3-19]|uniref:porin n=1 Tax=Ramlibacter sp. MMS24-I3-19 TaxID=3416606 RepID=UPI003CFF0500